MTRANDFPVIRDDYVTEGHARICRERGHATWIVDGVDMGRCPRCGGVTTPAAASAALVSVGERVTGKCVTTYLEHTGPVSSVDVAATYADGTPREYRVTITSDQSGRPVILWPGTIRREVSR